MDLLSAKYNSSRNTISVHGLEFTVKKRKDKECYYIHAGNRQIVVTDIVNREDEEPDPVFDYVFGDDGFELYPCPAMDYWIIRWRLKRKISIEEYKRKYL